MTNEEKQQVIEEYKARQRIDMKNRMADAAREAAAREAAALTDPLLKEALKKSLQSRREFHQAQIELIDQKLSAMG